MESRERSAAPRSLFVWYNGFIQWLGNVIPITPFCAACMVNIFLHSKLIQEISYIYLS